MGRTQRPKPQHAWFLVPSPLDPFIPRPFAAMKRHLVTADDRAALARVGVPMDSPVHAPFLTDATSQFNTLRQRVTPDRRNVQSDGPGHVGLLVYIKEFPQAKDPRNPQQDEIRDAVLAELQNSELIYLDHSYAAGNGQDTAPRTDRARRPETQEGPIKVYGNQGAQVLTCELWDLVNYLRGIKVKLANVLSYKSSRCLISPTEPIVRAHGRHWQSRHRYFRHHLRRCGLRSAGEFDHTPRNLVRVPPGCKMDCREGLGRHGKAVAQQGECVHPYAKRREGTGLPAFVPLVDLDNEQTMIRHFVEQIFIAKFGASPSNMVGIGKPPPPRRVGTRSPRHAVGVLIRARSQAMLPGPSFPERGGRGYGKGPG